MPTLKKKVLSLYLRTGCLRQLALNLYSDPERKARGMPPRQTARAGLGLAGAAGYAWQDEKMNELSTVFGAANVHINPKRTGNRPQSLDLADVLPVVQPYQFIAEGRYAAATTTFCTSVNIHTLCDQTGAPLGVGEVLPDIIQVLPSMLNRPPWELPPEDSEPLPSMLEVLSSGAARQLAPACRDEGPRHLLPLVRRGRAIVGRARRCGRRLVRAGLPIQAEQRWCCTMAWCVGCVAAMPRCPMPSRPHGNAYPQGLSAVRSCDGDPMSRHLVHSTGRFNEVLSTGYETIDVHLR
jgi:hypothetical protein